MVFNVFGPGLKSICEAFFALLLPLFLNYLGTKLFTPRAPAVVNIYTSTYIRRLDMGTLVVELGAAWMVAYEYTII